MAGEGSVLLSQGQVGPVLAHQAEVERKWLWGLLFGLRPSSLGPATVHLLALSMLTEEAGDFTMFFVCLFSQRARP